LVLVVTNRHAEVEAFQAAAEQLAPGASDAFVLGQWAVCYGTSANWAGRFGEAVDRAQRCRESTPDQMVAMAVFNDWCEALAIGGRGDYDQALQALRDIIATCERIGEVKVRARALNTIGWICGELQDHVNAMEWNKRGLEAAVEANMPDPELENNARLNLGDNLMASGRLDEGEEEFKRVEHVARNPRPQDQWMLWRYSQHLFHSYGELWLARADYDKAMAYADECLALAEQGDSKKNIVKGRRLRGQVFLARGKLPEAEQELAAALEIAKEIGNPPQLWKTHAALGDLRQAQGRPEEARQAYREALSVIDGVAAGLEDESLRETFLTSEHVEGIRRSTDDVS
jgi:tetratricopeptide (TPR) repeat protein